MPLVNLQIRVTGPHSVKTTLRMLGTTPTTEPAAPSGLEVLAARPAPTTAPASRSLDMWTKARSWVVDHLNEERALELSQQVTDSAEIAYMSLVAHKHILADNIASDLAYMSKQKTALSSRLRLTERQAELGETLSAHTATLSESLVAQKAALVESLADQKASLAEKLEARKATLGPALAEVADGFAAQKATLASGLATRKAALGDATNRLASRTQKMADGLAARKGSLASSAPAKKASQVLEDAAETLSKVQQSQVVRSVSERASVVATTVSGWANAALDESRVFASAQKV